MYHKSLGAQRGRGGRESACTNVARMQATITITRMDDSMERGGGGGGGQGRVFIAGEKRIRPDQQKSISSSSSSIGREGDRQGVEEEVKNRLR